MTYRRLLLRWTRPQRSVATIAGPFRYANPNPIGVYHNTSSLQRWLSSRSPPPWFVGTKPTLVRRCLFSSSSKDDASSNQNHDGKQSSIQSHLNNTDHDQDSLIYESPFGHVVTRLRAVSIFTAVVAIVGLPLMIALKTANGGVLPSAVVAASGMTFALGSMGSTAAIHFVFRPYVYTIRQIPIRKCHTPSKDIKTIELPKCQQGDDHMNKTTSDHDMPHNKCYQHYLFVAVTRNLFVMPVETVFDPMNNNNDVIPYQGFRPLCNILVNQTVPMYLHPEHVHHPVLLRVLEQTYNKTTTNPNPQSQLRQKENPDDELF